MTPLRVFIGYDPRQPVAAQVLAHSIWKHASVPVNITRLQLNQLPITRRGLTEFTYSRFLVPWLSGYDGTSIFLDSDILCRYDLADLLAYPLAYPETSVFVVNHEARKFERASVMVFNNALCITLTPEYIQDETHLMFDFKWTNTLQAILPKEWNHLVGYDAPNPLSHLVHFTQGIPVWDETRGCEFAEEWIKAFRESHSTVSFNALMGPSVHVPYVKQRLAKQAG